MSADNTILTLHLKDEFRVGHFQAVDNLWYTLRNTEQEENPVSARLFEYFKDKHSIPATVTNLEAETIALERAKRLYKEIGYVEYGISFLEVDKTFREIVLEALDQVKEEIAIVYASKKISEDNKIMFAEELRTTLNEIHGWLAVHE